MNVGIQAPPSITIISTASLATPRDPPGVWPIAATSRPNVAAISAQPTDDRQESDHAALDADAEDDAREEERDEQNHQRDHRRAQRLPEQQRRPRDRRAAQAFPQSALTLEQNLDAHVDHREEQKLNAHARRTSARSRCTARRLDR